MNFSVARATGDHADCGMTGPFAPGKTQPVVGSVVLHPGTNEIHGSVYEFLRNEKLDARSYFDQERGDFKRNQFGGTIGAPVVKNKLFFFGDYQGTREIRGVSSNLVNVPSVLERTGDFSELPDDFTGSVAGSDDPALGNFPSVLTQRLGYTVKSGEAHWFPVCNTTDPTTGCVFPGAHGPVIPQSAWSPVALATLKFIPTPNVGSGTFSTTAEK